MVQRNTRVRKGGRRCQHQHSRGEELGELKKEDVTSREHMWLSHRHSERL